MQQSSKTILHSYQDELNFYYLYQVSKTKALIKIDLLNHATKHYYFIVLNRKDKKLIYNLFINKL